MNKTSIALLIAALFVAACDKIPHGHDHNQPAAHAGHAHDHAPGTEKLTHFTAHTELFVEFPPLVAGETAAFAAHLTTLADFRALASGQVTAILSGDGQAEERFAVAAPSQPGIFRPAVLPRQAGTRELTIEVATPQFTVRHELGPVTVYPDRQSAEAAGGAHEEAGIAFTKEQQWKTDFATAEVVKRPLRPAIAATGVLRARPDGEALLTAPVAGQVQPAGKFPQLGQAVKKGDIIAWLAPRLGGETDFATLQADAARSRVALEHAERESARMEALFKDEAVPEKRLLDARTAAAMARAEHEAASRRLGQIGGSGTAGGIPIRAPVAGRIADVRVSPGTFAAEGALLFHIVDRRALWLALQVPESEAVRLTAPSGVAFHVDGIDTAFAIAVGGNGKLVAIGAAVDQETRSIPVLFEFSAPDPRLFVGMAVRAQLFTAAPRMTVAIPASAVVDDNGIPIVFVMIGGESFERRPVRVGMRDGDWVEVTEGLAPGSRVVARGAWLVKLAAANVGEIGHGHAH